MSLALVSRRAALLAPWLRNPLWALARAVPSLDLRFADDKSLRDAVSGQNLITFTRASGGTYVDSQGVIRNAVTNLLLRSEEFDNASWSKVACSVSANTVTSIAGTLTADKIVEDATLAQRYVVQSVTVSATDYTISFYAKAAERSIAVFYTDRGGVAQGFNLTGAGSLGGNYGSSAPTSASITLISDGWYRCTATWTATAGTAQIRIYPTNSSSVVVYQGDGTSGIYIWGAQLEQSSTVGEYVPTDATINSAPRFDHNPTTGESLGLLVEEQRSNLCLQSEAFGTSPWAASNVTVTPNTETSPAATLTADTLAATSANGTVTQPVTTTAVAMTFSVYLKRKTGTGNIDITADGTTWVTQTINSSTWTRCIVTQTAVAGTSNPGIRIVTSGDEVYAWGGQYE